MKPDVLETRAERRAFQVAFGVGTVTAFVSMTISIGLRGVGGSLWFTGPVSIGLGWWVYRSLTGHIRRRREILGQPFPPEWEQVLRTEVVFYRALDPEGQERFRRELQVFLGEKRVTGIKTTVDTTTLVLVGSSAIIPIFGYPDWEWNQISEVLVYPGRFGQDFGFESGEDRNTLGMVGTGPMNRIMILSKPDLLQGFRNPGDKRNVGLHEFAHLVDKTDGVIDGIPAVGLGRQSIGPWIELIRRKMQEIEAGNSDLNRYALTNEAEFFAVATEYLFERPDLMQRKHPELFVFMQKVFQQDLKGRLDAMSRERMQGPRQLGRNSPCPCGSGKKFKKCCLRAN